MNVIDSDYWLYTNKGGLVNLAKSPLQLKMSRLIPTCFLIESKKWTWETVWREKLDRSEKRRMSAEIYMKSGIDGKKNKVGMWSLVKLIAHTNLSVSWYGSGTPKWDEVNKDLIARDLRPIR